MTHSCLHWGLTDNQYLLSPFKETVADGPWVGLTNPQLVNCNNNQQCNNTLTWLSDGAPLDYIPNSQQFVANNKKYCMRRGNAGDKEVYDKGCEYSFPFICEFSCDKGIPLKITRKNCNMFAHPIVVVHRKM